MCCLGSSKHQVKSEERKLMCPICVAVAFIEMSARKPLVLTDLVSFFIIIAVHLSALPRSLHFLTVQLSLKLLAVKY